MTPELQNALAAMLGAFGMLALKEWVPGIIRWFTGHSARQKSLILAAQQEAEELEKEKDKEATARRRLEVHATALTRYLVELGWDPKDARLDWPKYE